ncbi:MAG: branched-chain amino acid ABC transporter permease, partial [Candidatus Bathyarchaeia archaeon]
MRINKKYVGTALGCLALLSLVPHYAPPYWVAFLFFCLIYIAICEMWVLITRAGMVLLGIYGFVGMGVYALVIFSTCLGYPLWISILLSGIIGVVLGLVVAPSIFKMRGQYFSMGSIVIAKALSAWFETWSYTGGGAGININANVSVTVLYYLGLALAVFSVLAVLLILRSKLGLMLKAIGNDEDAANTVGVNTFFVKLRCFILASFIIGIAGSMYFLYP